MSSSKIHPGVELLPCATVGEFVVIGEAPRGHRPGDLTVKFGKKAIIRSHTVVYGGVEAGDGFQCGHRVLIRENTKIGSNVSIGTGSVIEHQVVIRDGARIHSEAFIPEYSVIEEGVWVGPRVVLTNARYPNTPTTKNELMGVVLEKNSVIGANSTVLPGVRIGAGSLVGAGSVVTRDVPPGVVVAGNPARVLRSITEVEAYQFRSKQEEL